MAALNSDRDFTLSDLQTPTAIKALVLTAADGKPPFVYYEVGQRPGGSGGEVTIVVMPVDMMGGVSG